jgi:TPR repeat protein
MQIAEKVEKIKFVLMKYDSTYVEIELFQEIDNIYSLLCNNIYFDPKSDIEYLYCGWYEINIKKNYIEAKRHYFVAMKKGNIAAMNNLACIYEKIERDKNNAKKYYKMAVEKGNDMAMCNLASFFYKFEKDYENAKKYYLMSIEKGNFKAMENLAVLYQSVEKDYENAKKYCLMSIEKGNTSAMNNLAALYRNVKKDYANAKKYYKMSIDYGNVRACAYLADFYQDVEKDYQQELKYRLMYLRKNLHLKRQFFYYHILAQTGVLPKKNLHDVELHVIFYELLCFASKGCLPKGVMLKIAGSLFL